MSEADKDREIAELRARLEGLEGTPKPAAPKDPALWAGPVEPPAPARAAPPGNAFQSGFVGCFGVGAALIAVPIGLFLLLLILGAVGNVVTNPSGAPRPLSTNASDYIGHCAAALVRGQRLAPELYGMEASIATPVILNAGQTPLRVECGISSATRTGQMNILAYCGDALDMGCSMMERAWVNRRLVYPTSERRVRRRGNRHHD